MRSFTLAVAGCLVTAVGFAADSPPAPVEFDCQVSGDNDGCEKKVRCPGSSRIKRVRAACNLEWGTVSDAQLAAVPDNRIRVVRPSDHVSEGSCWIGPNVLGSGELAATGVRGKRSVRVGCQEHDRNGGDCQIRGVLFCE
jgi:hypothetical protein